VPSDWRRTIHAMPNDDYTGHVTRPTLTSVDDPPIEFRPDPSAVTHVLHGELAHTDPRDSQWLGALVFVALFSATIVAVAIVVAALILDS